jgi:hypothetical protein
MWCLPTPWPTTDSDARSHDRCFRRSPHQSGPHRSEAAPQSRQHDRLPDRRPTGNQTLACSGNNPTAATFDLRVGKHGSTLAGLTEALATAASLALQHGTPLAEITDAWQQTQFAPHGATDDPDIPDTTSLADYVARRLRLDHTPVGPKFTGSSVRGRQIAR